VRTHCFSAGPSGSWTITAGTGAVVREKMRELSDTQFARSRPSKLAESRTTSRVPSGTHPAFCGSSANAEPFARHREGMTRSTSKPLRRLGAARRGQGAIPDKILTNRTPRPARVRVVKNTPIGRGRWRPRAARTPATPSSAWASPSRGRTTTWNAAAIPTASGGRASPERADHAVSDCMTPCAAAAHSSPFPRRGGRHDPSGAGTEFDPAWCRLPGCG
jgi:hypothetical protein